MDHSFHDRVSLEMSRRVAAGLPSHPEWLVLARENLARWKERNADAPSLLDCYAEWEAILSRPLPDICGALTGESDESRRLRTNSPFAGALSSEEVRDIKRRFMNDQNAA